MIEKTKELFYDLGLNEYAKHLTQVFSIPRKFDYINQENLDNASIIELIQYIRVIGYELANLNNTTFTGEEFDNNFKLKLQQHFQNHSKKEKLQYFYNSITISIIL